jgi:hypothetical protein
MKSGASGTPIELATAFLREIRLSRAKLTESLPPAPEGALGKFKAKLGAALPDDYRSFLF